MPRLAVSAGAGLSGSSARRSRSLRMPGRTAARAAASLHMPDLRDPRAAPGSVSRQRRPLDTFFPFDPYLLRRSAAQLDLRRSYIRHVAAPALLRLSACALTPFRGSQVAVERRRRP